MNPKAQLAEFVADHLGDHANLFTAALGTACVGIANIGAAYADVQAKRGNWSVQLENLRSGCEALEQALPVLKQQNNPGAAAVVEMGEREARFGRLLEEEIQRLTAGESTLA